MKYELAINMAMTLDGKVARPDGKWYGLCSKTDRIQMDIYRSQAKALIVGKNSILNDNPITHLKYVESKESPRIILLLQSGFIPPDRNIFLTAKKPLIFCTNSNYNQLRGLYQSSAELILVKEQNHIPPQFVLEVLLEKGYDSILLEGGPKLNYSFFKEDLVNTIHLTIVPYIIGKNTLPAFIDGKEEFPNFDQKKWELKEIQQKDNEIFVTYRKFK